MVEVTEEDEPDELDVMPRFSADCCLLLALFEATLPDLVNPAVGGGGGMSCGGEECGEEKVSVAGEPVDTKPESSPEDDSLIDAENRFDCEYSPFKKGRLMAPAEEAGEAEVIAWRDE